MTEQAFAVMDRLSRDLEPVEEACRQAEWEAETTGADAAFETVRRLRAQIMQRLANREDFAVLERARTNATLPTLQQRSLLRWRHRMASMQCERPLLDELARQETEIVQRFNAFRAQFNGVATPDNRIDEILALSTASAEVEAVWRASKQVATHRHTPTGPTIVDRLRQLVRLRNEIARQVGYPNFYRMSLELSELDPDWLLQTLEQLEAETREPFLAWKGQLDARLAARFGIAPEQLRPWHYADRFFQRPPLAGDQAELDQHFKTKDTNELTIRTFDDLGFDIRPIIACSDLYPNDRPTSRKCQHAFCTSIRSPDDIRVLCNIVPGVRWLSTNLHEFGHAIYGSSLDAKLPYILREDAHLLANESIALLMERHLQDARWLERVAGLTASDAQRFARAGQRDLAIKHLVFTRWVLVMCAFERALYENPDRTDLGPLWWDLVEKHQHVRRPAPDHRADDWASKIHFVSSPVYYQNYLLGEVFGAQLQAGIARQTGGMFGHRPAGQWLRDKLFAAGATRHWRDVLEAITDEPFTTRHFLAILGYARD